MNYVYAFSVWQRILQAWQFNSCIVQNIFSWHPQRYVIVSCTVQVESLSGMRYSRLLLNIFKNLNKTFCCTNILKMSVFESFSQRDAMHKHCLHCMPMPSCGFRPSVRHIFLLCETSKHILGLFHHWVVTHSRFSVPKPYGYILMGTS